MIGAGTSVEHDRLRLRNDVAVNPYGVQFNISLNNSCSLTKRCGSRCFLNVVQPDTPELEAGQRADALREIMDAGPIVRHMSFVEKEPFESPEQLRAALVDFHSRSRDQRPQAIGCITNGLPLGNHLDWLADSPLDWCLTSLDGEADTHLRGRMLWTPALHNLVEAKRLGAVRLIGINTVVTEENMESVIRLGRRLPEFGIDYWGLGVYLTNQHGVMTSTLSPDRTRECVHRIAEGIADSPVPAVFELDEGAFELITGTRPRSVRNGPWRLEHPIAGTPLRIATMSPEPGRFFRFRFDGQLLDKADLLTVGAVETRYGKYAPGKITQLLTSVREAWGPAPTATIA